MKTLITSLGRVAAATAKRAPPKVEVVKELAAAWVRSRELRT